ncbi:MAG: hypothetical protein J7L96_06200, partial [Bacteroidales bacterium]|nr:hypothetical protein [Bacteroidales bacterium]
AKLYTSMARGKYLLCYPDLPWIPDPVRENSDKRMTLHAQYESEILKLTASYAIVKGQGSIRLREAQNVLESWGLKTNNS